MRDPDPAQPVLRLGALAAGSALSPAEEMADIERQMRALSLRYCELALAMQVKIMQSEPIPASATHTDNDFWTNRHRVMAGPDPMIARSAGHTELLRAAARGEIGDPAESLRREFAETTRKR